MSIWIDVCLEHGGELVETTEHRWFACSKHVGDPMKSYYSSKVYDEQEDAARDYCIGAGLLEHVLAKRGENVT